MTEILFNYNKQEVLKELYLYLVNTVSYNGFTGLHESSGIITNTSIGTVVSTIDELDVYSDKQVNIDTEEDNPKVYNKTRPDHPKVKVSDTTGDKLFMVW